jgi:hypothetical protein
MLNFKLYSADGLEIFEDWSSEDPEWLGQKLPKGLIRTSCSIPANLLNAGTYRIRAQFFDGNTVTEIYDFDDGVFFNVVDTSVRPVPWFGGFAGPVHPKLGWRTQVIDHEQD